MAVALFLGQLCNGQQSGSAVNSCFDQGKIEAMKLLSGCEAAHSDEHQFLAKFLRTLEPFSSFCCLTSGLNKETMALLLLHTFVFNCLLRCFWATM